MDYIVSVKGVSKSYGEVQALKDVCFEVKPGEIFGLIGPDGAGKTTLFRILTTLVLADEGKAEVCGQDVVKNYKEIRRQAGYMPGRFSLYDEAGEAIPIDYEKSIELLERAKKLGDADAQRQIDYLKEISLKQNNEIPEN